MTKTIFYRLAAGAFAGIVLIAGSLPAAGVVPAQVFDSMYAAAARGDVPTLRNALHRGLRIDSLNRDGDTGVCAAIKRGDYQAYNSFVAAGARRNPGCLRRISSAEYKKFIQSDRVALPIRNQYTPPISGTPANGGLAPRYVSDHQMNIVQRELNYTAQTGNAYNLLYLPAALLFSFFP